MPLTDILLPYSITATVIILAIAFYGITKRRSISQEATQRILSHLRISQEGLGIFDSRRRIVFANTLFNQYCDIISDVYLSNTQQILEQSEFRGIRLFVDDWKNTEEKEQCYSSKIEKSGKIFSLRCVRFGDGGFVISINDITQTEEQTRLKQQLTQNVAHEFKTPVCSIQGYLETIIENYPHNLTQEKLMHFLKRCYSQSNRLHNLVNDISQLNSMSDTHQQVKMEQTDVALIINNMLQEIGNSIQEHNITIDNDLPKHLFIEADVSMLYSIFRNLFDNAISYAGDGSTIRLQCFRQDEQFCYFSFSDNGAGVPSEHLNRLFERFYRVDKGRSRKIGGTGLGLAIVKNAVSLHGGTITARQAQGGGLEFVFTLKKQQQDI